MGASECYPDRSPKVTRLLDTLSNAHRREVVYYFESVSESPMATLDDLVSHIVRRVPDADLRDVELCLLHVHLPMLASRGWLDFDTRTGAVHYHGHDQAAGLLGELLEVFGA